MQVEPAMTSLMMLPDDILFELLKQSESISDSLRLGMCCRRLYGLLDQNRLGIMRCVILHSDIHKYDVRLCNLKDTYDAWASEFLQDFRDQDNPIPPEVHPPSSTFIDCVTAKTLSDQQVWDVVARWHGLALLHKLYFHPYINLAYRKYISQYKPVYETRSLEQGNPLLKERALALQRELSTTKFRKSLVPSCDTKERFYMALTGYWLAVEGARTAKVCQYPLQSTELAIYAEVDALWEAGRSLRESLDMLEVYDFVYGYLIRQTAPAGFNTFARWVENQGWLEPDEPPQDQWRSFIQNMRLRLSPADVIELLLFTSRWKHASENQPGWSSNEKARYLRLRAFFETPFPGHVAFRDVGQSPDTWYSSEDLERAVALQLQKHFGDQEWSPQQNWEDYRRTKWNTDIRGRALLWGKPDPVVKVVDRIKSLSERGTDSA